MGSSLCSCIRYLNIVHELEYAGQAGMLLLVSLCTHGSGLD